MVTAPSEGMTLTANMQIRSPDLAKACGLAGDVVPRGTGVPISALALCRNADILISSGRLQWRAPSAPRPALPPAPKAPDVLTVVPRDDIEPLVDALWPRWSKGVPLDTVKDLVSCELIERAQRQFAGTVGKTSHWGRSIAGFWRHVEARLLARQKHAADPAKS